ncbi:MAG: hypothetical protein AAF485_30165, partial [Chloroflexota bacterium]
VIQETEEPTPTPEPTEEPTTEATVEATTESTTNTASNDSSSSAGGDDADAFTPQAAFVAGESANMVANGDFETSFGDNGVAADWESFQTGAVIVSFSPEEPGPYVKDGNGAQRITLAEAYQQDQYAGLYQQIYVIPDETYTFDVSGQIRTGSADVNLSSYGYRVQYAVDETGNTNWQDVPAESWMEIQWDEQLLHTPEVSFLDYSTEIVPTSSQITLFIRAWNKWADPGEAQYTFDSLSFTGPSVIAVAMMDGDTEPGAEVSSEATTSESGDSDDEGTDEVLPTTGDGDELSDFVADGRFWGALLVLLLLGAVAFYRARRGGLIKI